MSRHHARGLLAASACVIALVLVPTAGAGTPPESAIPAPGIPQLLSVELLGPDVKRERWDNGVTFVGSTRATVLFLRDGTPVVEVAGPSSETELVDWANAYALSGRSLRADLLALGAGPRRSELIGRAMDTAGGRSLQYVYQTPNVVYDSGCLQINDSNRTVHSCYLRKGTNSSDANAYYMADSSQGSGNSKGSRKLRSLTVRHTYLSPGQIVNWRPAQDQTTGSCGTVQAGATFFGATLSVSYSLCPQKVDITIGPLMFDSSWLGCVSSSITRSAGAANWTRQQRGGSGTLYFLTNATTSSSC